MAKDNEKLLKTMLERFKLSAEAESDNRQRGLDALKFRVGGDNQWDQNMLRLRQADNRPSETYNQIPQFIHQITNDMRMNMPQVKFIPGKDGTKEVATVYEDLARNIQAESEAEVAFDTAADFQVTIGWGYFRVLTDYEDDNSFDQIIKIGWVPNPFCVYDDPHTTMQDRSDRKYLFYVSDIPVDEFNEGRDKKDQYGSNELSSIGDSAPGWATEDTVRVVEYWTVEEEKSKLYLKDGKTTKKRPKNFDEENDKEREVCEYKVRWRKCTATEVLDEKVWAGKYIPFVFVSGEELNIDGKKELSGLVRYMMAPQRQYNYWTNAATEMVALAPKAPFIMDPRQIEGYEKYWDQANVKNYPYLPAKMVVDNQVLPAPMRNQAEPPIQAMMAMVQGAQNNLYTTTGIYPAALGKQGNETSGKAINARKVEGETSNFHFPDNMARAIRFLGRILADLFPKIYDTPRKINGLKEDRSNVEVTINEPYEEDGEQKLFDLTLGTYDVAVTTGPSYTTKRQEAADSMTQVVQAYPELMAVAGDLVIGSYDWPGAEKLAERIKKTLPQGLADEPKKGEIPPQVQMQMQQAQQMIDQLTQTVNQQADELESKQADIANKQADLALKEQEIQSRGQSEALKAETDRMKYELEAAKLEFERMKLEAELNLEQAKLDLDATKMRVDAKLRLKERTVNQDGEAVEGDEDEMVMTDPDFHNGPSPMTLMMEQFAITLQNGLAQIAEMNNQGSQAIVESNLLVAQSNAQVAQAINTPKGVIRDAEGRIAGIQ